MHCGSLGGNSETPELAQEERGNAICQINSQLLEEARLLRPQGLLPFLATAGLPYAIGVNMQNSSALIISQKLNERNARIPHMIEFINSMNQTGVLFPTAYSPNFLQM